MFKNQPKPLKPGSRPTVTGKPRPDCPIPLEAKAVLEKASDLHRAIRKLRLSSQRCLTCPESEECPTLRYFAQAIDTAIHELRQEWGLDHE